jgi:hypothetical protein
LADFLLTVALSVNVAVDEEELAAAPELVVFSVSSTHSFAKCSFMSPSTSFLHSMQETLEADGRLQNEHRWESS